MNDLPSQLRAKGLVEIRNGDLLKDLKILSLGSLFLLGCLLVAITFLLFWATHSWIVIEARGNGVVLNPAGLYQVSTRSEGTIRFFTVHQGQEVKKGDLLAKIYNPQIELRLESARVKLNNLQQEFQKLKDQIATEEKALKSALKREIQASEYVKNQIEQEINSLTNDWTVKKQFFEKGLISYVTVQQAEFVLVQKEIEEESIKEKLANLHAEIDKGYRVQEVMSKESSIEEQKKDVAILESQISSMEIYSPYDGTIIAFLKDTGGTVHLGEPLLVIEPIQTSSTPFVVYGYFPIDTGQAIQVGTPVEMEFTFINENEYGKMKGVVHSVSKYAVSSERLAETLYNQEMIKKLLEGAAAVLEVIIDPLKDSNNPGEYLWTTGSHPSIPITTGLQCVLYADVEEKKPLYFIFPFSSLKRAPLIKEITPSS